MAQINLNLKSLIPDCKINRKVSERSSLTFYIGEWKQKKQVMIKCLHKTQLPPKRQQRLKQTQNNWNDIHKSIKNSNSPNITKVFEIRENTQWKVSIEEYHENLVLLQNAIKSQKLDELKSIETLLSIINGYKVFYENREVHKRLSTLTILYNKKECKIPGYELCEPDVAEIPLYIPPEIADGKQWTQSSDLWCLGIIFYQLLFGFFPYDELRNQNQIDQFHKVIDKSRISLESKEFLKAIFQLDPLKRLQWKSIYKMQNNNQGIFSKVKIQDPRLVRLKANSCIILSIYNGTIGYLMQNEQIINEEADNNFLQRLNYFQILINSQMIKLIEQNEKLFQQLDNKQEVLQNNNIVAQVTDFSKQIYETRKQLLINFRQFHTGIFHNLRRKLNNLIVYKSTVTNKEIRELQDKYIMYECGSEQHQIKTIQSICLLSDLALDKNYKNTGRIMQSIAEYMCQYYPVLLNKIKTKQ